MCVRGQRGWVGKNVNPINNASIQFQYSLADSKGEYLFAVFFFVILGHLHPLDDESL